MLVLYSELNVNEVIYSDSSCILFIYIHCNLNVSALTGQNCKVLKHFFHSLDVWHKSVKLTAKLSAVSISF